MPRDHRSGHPGWLCYGCEAQRWPARYRLGRSVRRAPRRVVNGWRGASTIGTTWDSTFRCFNAG